MCGIIGFIGGNVGLEQKPLMLKHMLATLNHRGPDEMGYYYDQHIGLANARLSIIDLNGGRQPMCDESNRHWLVYNGEIFNYIELRQRLSIEGVKFRDQSDTEVLLKTLLHWGIQRAVEELNGQFAFALYDSEDGKVLLGRDRFGEQPLYIYERQGFLAFASEIKAFACLPGVQVKLDQAKLAQAAMLWTTLPQETVFKYVYQLPPSHFAVIVGGVKTQFRYGDKLFRPNYLPKTSAEAAEAVRYTLKQSVRLRLQSDVKIGVYLSGGLDSTITSALAAEASSKGLTSFSVAFDDSDYDEYCFQQKAAKALGLPLESLRINYDDIRRTLPDVINHAETILFRTALVPLYLLAQQVNKSGAKVIVTGEGADEMFLGYDIFKEAWLIEHFDTFEDDNTRIKAIANLYPYLPHFTQRQSKVLLAFYQRAAAARQHFSPAHILRLQNGRLAASLFDNQLDETTLMQQVGNVMESFMPKNGNYMMRTAATERYTLMHGYLLSSQGDRMNLAFSLEGRHPFLDPHVAALADCLPMSHKLKNGTQEKWILKQAFKNIIPASIINRSKQPYRAPGATCLLKGKDDWLDELLSENNLRQSSIVDQASAAGIIDQIHALPNKRISPKLDMAYLALVSSLLLENWCKGLSQVAYANIDSKIKIAVKG